MDVGAGAADRSLDAPPIAELGLAADHGLQQDMILARDTGHDSAVSTGELQGPDWYQALGGPRLDEPKGVAVDSTGRIALSGFFSQEMTFDGAEMKATGQQDALVVGYDGSRQPAFSGHHGGGDNDTGYSIAVDDDGNIYVAGRYTGSARFDPSAPPRDSTGGTDAFLVSYDASWQHRWSLTYGGTLDDSGMTVAIDNAGRVHLAGTFRDTADFGKGSVTAHGDSNPDIFMVAVAASDGKHLWSRTFGGEGEEDLWTNIADAKGNIYLTGHFVGPTDFGGKPASSNGNKNYDGFYAGYAADTGELIFAKTFGGKGYDSGHGLAVDALGNIHLSGTFEGDIDFDGEPLKGQGKLDMVLASFRCAGP